MKNFFNWYYIYNYVKLHFYVSNMIRKKIIIIISIFLYSLVLIIFCLKNFIWDSILNKIVSFINLLPTWFYLWDFHEWLFEIR